MTTLEQDKAFLEEVISTDLLERAVDWISENLEPDDVFTEARLKEWALANDFKEAE